MNNFQQSGEIYIKFDNRGLPEYFFACDLKTRTINKLQKLTNRELTSVELPTWDVAYHAIKPEERNDNFLQVWQNHQTRLANQPDTNAHPNTGLEKALANYAQGSVKVANQCFAGYHDLQVTVPCDYAVRFDHACFDKDANIELVIPEKMALKDVHHARHTGFTYDRERWTLLAHEAFNFNSTSPRESYSVHDFNPSDANCQLTVTHPNKKLSTCLVEGHQALHGKIVNDVTNLANHWVRLHGDWQELHQNLHQHLHALRENIHQDVAQKLDKILPPLQK